MSEKRFIIIDHSTCVFDKITKEEYVCIDREEAFLVCKRLNDQQATISRMEEENEQLEKGKMEALSLLGEEIDKNEQLRKQLDFYLLDEFEWKEKYGD